MCYMSDIAQGSTSPADPGGAPSGRGRRVAKGYESVARELRALILNGSLAAGERLPREADLAERFGVSRATVREALRLCAGQGLIHTAEGSSGGSFVARPSSGHISDTLRSGLDLLAAAQQISLEDLLEVRLLLEVPAARYAALRRTDEDVDRLVESSPIEVLKMSPTDQFVHNKEFHSVLIEASGNPLLEIAARPIFTVLQRNLGRSRLEPRFHRAINVHHHRIAAAVAAGDPDAAEREMADHLEFLRPFYERAWRHLVAAAERP
jgi:DNA-binding FadR family transcriptional regulator